jgi:adenine-specific DNA-methyltransferase
MKDRIAESIPLLNNDGLHQCHIDENEYEKLQQILDATTLHSSGTLIWDKKNPMLGRKGLSTQHEYVLFNSVKDVSIFRKNTNIRSMLTKARELIKVNNGDLSVAQKEFIKWINSNPELSGGEKAYKFIDEDGMVYRLASLSAGTPSADPRYFIPQRHPDTNEECPVPPTGWSRPPETFERLKEEGRIVFGKDHTTLPQIKLFLTEDSKRQFSSVYSLASRGKNDVQALGYEFPYCHPVVFYEELIGCSLTHRKDTILDYYGGSGTAGHAALNLIKESGVNFNYILAEMGDHFDNVLKPRITKVIYSSDWKNGKPTSRDTGISHCFKTIRLESYEDTLNNLVFDDNPVRGKAIESNPSLKEDYMLRYLLDVETRGSQSLLNIDAFADPTAYALVVKKPGSDEQVKQPIDLIETFNYLLGLRLETMAAPQTFTASFTRKPDPELPEDQHTKLVVDGKIQQTAEGKWWFRKLEGWVPADPMNPNNGQKERVLIVWRTLTGNLEEDNRMLDEWFEKTRISTRDFEYDTIYVNGSNNLPNLKKDDEHWKVRLIEEEFHKKMWEVGE